MSPDNARVNAVDELSRAEETLRAADVLLHAELASDAVGRAYYAAFHAVRALLFSIGTEPRSHRGALHLFNLHFIRTGKIDSRHLAALARAQFDRATADYGAAPRFSSEEAREQIASAREFLAEVRALLVREGQLPA